MDKHSVLSHFSCVLSRCAFIDGVWTPPISGSYFKTIDPASEQILTEVADCCAQDVDEAVAAAVTALNGPHWGFASRAHQRAVFLRRLASIIEDNRLHLSNLDSLDEGKPKRESYADIGDAIALALHLADVVEMRETKQGRRIETGSDDFTTAVYYEPIGVVAAITPWNYPFLMGAQKVFPALAAGCCVVLKPSELAPLSCLALAHLCSLAGLPQGALNVVPGLGSSAGAALAGHPIPDKISFTGSLPTARKIMAAASLGPRALSLELGGKSPLIVFDDANINAAIDWVITGFIWGSGQVCSSTSRLLLHASIADTFIHSLKLKLTDIRLCSAEFSGEGAAMGPVASRQQYDKIWSYIEDAKSCGCECIYGGSRDHIGLPPVGLFVPPTVFLNPPTESNIWLEEIFGPVLCVKIFHTEKEAIDLGNASKYGLAGAVFSNNEQRCARAAKSMRVGVMWINCSQPAFVQAPWGGCKNSGFGRELGEWGLDEFTNIKQVTSCADGFSWNLWA